ncbi:MAG: hypothetical protein JSW60_09785, partial [Thermoplasmatales archaeon]
MKNKIFGTFVCMLLIATALPAVGTLNNSFHGENPVDMPLNGGWTKTFGGSEYDFGDCVQQTSDGGYIIGAETMSYGAGDLDVWLIKTDADGNEEWNTTIGGIDYEFPNFILQTTDGGYILTGLTYSFGAGKNDVWLIQTDANGTEEWNKTYGGTENDIGLTVWNTTDGGYIIGGRTNSFGAGLLDYWLIKTDANGTEEWNKTYGGTGNEVCMGMQPADGGYIFVGYVEPEKIFDKAYCWLVKTDADGNKLWDKPIKGTGHSGGRSIRQTPDGGYIIAGETKGFGLVLGQMFIYVGGDMWLVKTDADGNKTWEKSFGRIILEDGGWDVELTDEGGYIVAGFTKGFGSSIKQFPGVPIFSKIWVVETDANGTKV